MSISTITNKPEKGSVEELGYFLDAKEKFTLELNLSGQMHSDGAGYARFLNVYNKHLEKVAENKMRYGILDVSRDFIENGKKVTYITSIVFRKNQALADESESIL